MSTRHVWRIYNCNSSYSEVKTKGGKLNSPPSVYAASSYSFDPSTGMFSLVNGSLVDGLAIGRYFIVGGTSGPSMYYNAGGGYAHNSGFYFDTWGDPYTYTSKKNYYKGSYVRDVSSANADQYPENSHSGSYWYVKAGQDSIDPAAVTLPEAINGGQNVTITVTPSGAMKYGGIISYQFQYRLDGGGWQALEVSDPTALSQSLTVPEGHRIVTVRALASDSMGFTSTTWVESAPIHVNQLPTAPGSIQVTNVTQGENATITITAATDPDGTVARYVYERSVDGGLWEQIADVNALTLADRIGEWAVVAYRAKAVDNEGAGGPYVIAEQQNVNVNWIYISGPNADMGDKSVPFNLALVIGVSSHTKVTDINVEVQLDGVRVYSNTVPQGTSITIPIDTRTMSAGQHTVQVTATKSDYLGANNVYTFTVPSIVLPTGGYAQQLQDAQGQAIFPVTTARYVVGDHGKNVQEQIDRLSKAGRGKTGHLEFVDALMGPVSNHKIDRAKGAAYAATIFSTPGEPSAASVSIPANYTGDVGGVITVAENELTIKLNAGTILNLYQYTIDTEETP